MNEIEWNTGKPKHIGPFLVTFIGQSSGLHLVGMGHWDNEWYLWGTKELFDMEIVAWAYLPLPAR